MLYSDGYRNLRLVCAIPFLSDIIFLYLLDLEFKPAYWGKNLISCISYSFHLLFILLYLGLSPGFMSAGSRWR